MAWAESMADVRHHIFDPGALARLEWIGLREAVAKFAADRLATHQLLIARHVDAFRIGRGIGVIVGIDIDQSDDEIGIRTCGRYAKNRGYWARNADVAIQRLSLVDQHIGA